MLPIIGYLLSPVRTEIINRELLGFEAPRSICGFLEVCKNVHSFSDVEACLEAANPEYCEYNVHASVSGIIDSTCYGGTSALIGDWATQKHKGSTLNGGQMSVVFEPFEACGDCEIFPHATAEAKIKSCLDGSFLPQSHTVMIAITNDSISTSLDAGYYNDPFVYGVHFADRRCRRHVKRIEFTFTEVHQVVSPAGKHLPVWRLVDFVPSVESEVLEECSIKHPHFCTDLESFEGVARCLRTLPESCRYEWTVRYDAVLDEWCHGSPNYIELGALTPSGENSNIDPPESIQLVSGQLQIVFEESNKSCGLRGLYMVEPEEASCGGTVGDLLPAAIQLFSDGQGVTFTDSLVDLKPRLMIEDGPCRITHAYLHNARIKYIFKGALKAPKITRAFWVAPGRPACAAEACQHFNDPETCVEVVSQSCIFIGGGILSGSSTDPSGICPTSLVARIPIMFSPKRKIARYNGVLEVTLGGSIGKTGGGDVDVYLVDLDEVCPEENLSIEGMDPFLQAQIGVDGKVVIPLSDVKSPTNSVLLVPVVSGRRSAYAHDLYVQQVTFKGENDEAWGMTMEEHIRGSLENISRDTLVREAWVPTDDSPTYCSSIQDCVDPDCPSIEEAAHACERLAPSTCTYYSRNKYSARHDDVCPGRMKALLDLNQLTMIRGMRLDSYRSIDFYFVHPTEIGCDYNFFLTTSCQADPEDVEPIAVLHAPRNSSFVSFPEPQTLWSVGPSTYMSLETPDVAKCGLAFASLGYGGADDIFVTGAKELYQKPTSAAELPETSTRSVDRSSDDSASSMLWAVDSLKTLVVLSSLIVLGSAW